MLHSSSPKKQPYISTDPFVLSVLFTFKGKLYFFVGQQRLFRDIPPMQAVFVKLDSDSNSCKGCLQVLCFLETFLYQTVCIRAEDISSWQIIYLCHLLIEWLIFFLTPYRALNFLEYMQLTLLCTHFKGKNDTKKLLEGILNLRSL